MKYPKSEETQNMRFRVHAEGNDTFLAIAENQTMQYDNKGAVFYVVFVVLVYGLSIVMMIASHIRKNKHDSHLRSYLKEMTVLRKKTRREHLLEKMASLALKSGSLLKQKNENAAFDTFDEEEAAALIDEQLLESDNTARGLLERTRTSNGEDDVTNKFASLPDHPDDNCVQTTEL